MPYSNIVFVKLFIAIIDEDDRFLYQLNESQQLLYLKMLILAGKTGNNIPKTYSFIKNTINYGHEQSCFEADVKRIMGIFPKFRETSSTYYFEKFEELHNYINREKSKAKKQLRKSQGTPKELQRIVPEVEVEVEVEEDIEVKNTPGVPAGTEHASVSLKPKQKLFVIPMIEEVSDYIYTNKLRVNPQKFHAHYTSNGWRVGKNPMKNWKAAIITWQINE